MGQASPRPLPVVLPPYTGELLSSWITRHAAFYAVPPMVMLKHCLPEATSLRAADLHLSDDQAGRLAHMFSTKATRVRRMTFTNIPSTLHRFIAAKPVQVCRRCGCGDAGLKPILRRQLSGWRITCQNCGDLLVDGDARDRASPFRHYETAALRGQKLIDGEVERGVRTWTSPTGIARLLLMRRIPSPLFRAGELWRFRVLGAIIPELDEVCGCEQVSLPSPAHPILPVHLRPAWLAGVAMVEHDGLAMLDMLQRRMMGENWIRFGETVTRMTAMHEAARHGPQLQLI